MNRDERLYEIYLKWFKLGFEQRLYYLHNPNRWINIDDSFDIDYKYKATFIESLPWNNRWVCLGYKDGYNFVDPFNYANKMPDESCIKKFFNSRRYKN